jgi:hypothetical protein
MTVGQSRVLFPDAAPHDAGNRASGFHPGPAAVVEEFFSDHPALFAAEPQPATGVEQLVINGELVIEDGRLNPVLPGRAIRRRAR